MTSPCGMGVREQHYFYIHPPVTLLATLGQSMGGSFVVVRLYTSVVSYVAFVLSLFVPHHSFFLCLVKAVLFDYCIA